MNNSKKAIIIGASSGIGRELAMTLSAHQYEIGLVARREYLLEQLQQELPTQSYIKKIDISDPEYAMKQLESLIEEMGPIDLIIISSGIGELNKELDWEIEKDTIAVNVHGVTAMINVSMKHFLARNHGHLVVISSIAALRGSAEGLAYNASKAFLSNYVEGLRGYIAKNKKEIAVTDIRPGFVDTPMAKGNGLFWVQPVPKVAHQIWNAILKKKKVAYITKRWAIIAFIIKILPNWLYDRI